MEDLKQQFDIGASSTSYREKYGFYDPENYVFKSKKGLSHEVVEEISWMKNEPEWMRQFRHRALDIFYKKPMPTWGGDLSEINFDDIYYFVRATEKQGRSWDEIPPEIKNTFDKLGIPEAEQKFLAGVGAQYECLSGDTRVYTARGLTPIKDVLPGDIVFSFDEVSNQLVPASVKATAAKGERKVFEVRVGTRTIKATANHPFLVLEYRRGLGKLRGRYHRTWKYLHELKPGDLIAVAKQLPDVGEPAVLRHPQIKTTVTGRNQSVEYVLDISNRYNPITLPDRSSPDLMWWLGLYLGDGYIHRTEGADKARVIFAIPETDQPLRQELVRVTENLFKLSATNGDPYRMTINSTILARYLEENGFAGDALTKRIPGWVFALSQDQKLEFLGGYLDSDGYVRDHPANHDLVLTSANQALLQDVKNLCAQCGLTTSSIHRFESKHPFDKDRKTVGYRMQISGDFERVRSRSPQRTNRFGKRKYHHNFSSAHGTSFHQHTNEYIGFAKIDSITPAGIEQVYDIEVDGPHNFVAEGLIVHNSEVVYHNIKESLAKQGVIFVDTDTALKEYPELLKKYFGTIVPPADNKFAALNSAVWSGGCLTAEARVFTTHSGVKSIAEVRAGDTVFALSPAGQLVPAKVLAHVHSGQKPVYRFRVAGRTLEATGNHMFLTLEKSPGPLDRYGRKWSMVWKPLEELQEGSIIAIAKRIPTQGQSIGSLLDADGWLENEGKTVAIELANQKLVEDIKLLAISCGLFSDGKIRERQREAVFFKRDGRYIMSGNSHACRITGNVALLGTRNPHHRARLEEADKHTFDKYNTVTGENLTTLASEDIGFAPIRDKEYIGVRDVYDIQVDGYANFVANGIIAHNSFIYVPPGVHVEMPLQAYFRINAKNVGQFERTLIIADEGSFVHYVEGCTAPIYSSDSLHSAVVEIVVLKGARVRYTTIQNWSTNVYNLVTKRAVAKEDATMEWVDANLGCLTSDTQVFLNNNVKAISDVEPGDTVYSVDGEMNLVRSKVVAKRYSGKQKVYRLRTENHREIKATANHPFLALTKQGKHVALAWKRLDQLKPDDLVAIAGNVPDSGVAKVFESIPTRGRKPVTLPEASSEELMWLLGLYTGDGFLDGARVCFAVPPTDRAYPRLIALLKALFGVEHEIHGNAVRVNSSTLKEWVVSLGLGGNAHQKRVPQWVYTLPKAQRVAFIEGYIAADGYRRSNHKNLSITSANRALLEDIKILAMTCGLDPRKISQWTRGEKKPLGKGEKEYTHYFLYFGEGQFEQPIHFSRVSKIEPLGVQDTWDLEIANNHNFIANGFVVHNSKLTMKYPSIYLMGKGAHGEVLSVAFAGKGQHQDAGGKAVHGAPYTSSQIISKSISKDGGRTSYRGLLQVYPGAEGSKSKVQCDALLLDDQSRSDTYPYIDVQEDNVTIGHEASVSKIGEEQLFYLTSRGLTEAEASTMVVSGFVEPIVKELPMEFAVEMNRLLQLQMEGSVG